MELPLLSITGDISFQMQSGLIRDTVTIDTNELNLKSLKDLACNFIDRKYPEHGLNKLNERLVIFKHDYTSTNLLTPINVASDVTNGTLVEVVVSTKDPSDEVQIRPHSLLMHSYKSPTFCDFCGEMLFGLVKQGLKCEGCGLNYHKRCAYKIPNNCNYARRRRSSTHLMPTTPTNESVHRTASSSATLLADSLFPLTSPQRDRRASSGYEKSPNIMGRPAWVEIELANRLRIPHSFVVHSYTRPTICQHCKKLLKGLFRQGYQCKDCKFNAHKKCMEKVPWNCTGEAPQDYVEGDASLEKENLSDSDVELESVEKKRNGTYVEDIESDNQPIA